MASPKAKNPFDQNFKSDRKPFRESWRKLPPGNVFEVISGPTGPRLWDNIREGFRRDADSSFGSGKAFSKE